MNEQVVLQQFVQKHNILMTEAVQRESTAIYWTRRARIEINALESSLNKLGKMIVGPFVLYLMLIRIFEYTEESLVALITGQRKSANVIARTVAESAITLIYILQDDRASRLVQYFLNSIKRERDKLEKLRKIKASVSYEPSFFDNKVRALDLLENFVKGLAKETGDVKTGKGWPNIFEVFEKSGYEEDYRTVYARMSSMVHNIPVQLLCSLMFIKYAFGSGDVEMMDMFIDGETRAEHMIVYSGVFYCLEAASKYSTCFGFTEATDSVFKGKDVISTILSQMAMQLEQATEGMRQ